MSTPRQPDARRWENTRPAAVALAAALAIGAIGAAPGVSTPAPGVAAAEAAPKKNGKARGKAKERALRRANRKQERPNVIVVMTDDQEDSMAGLPRTVDLIGNRGTTFTNSYVSFPLCCPARATFLTGQHAHNHGVFSTQLPNGYNGLDHRNTLAVWLKRAGYRTGMVGKYLNGYGLDDGISERRSDAKERPPGWNEWVALTDDTDQRRYRYKLNQNGKIFKYGKGRHSYVTDVLANKAIDFVRRRAPRPKPFFLWFNPSAPHGEAGRPTRSIRNPTPAPRHYGAFEGAFRPRTPNFNEADVRDKPGFVTSIPRLGPNEILDIDQRYRGRAESLLSVDEAVKKLMRRVAKAGDKRKTYVVFTSDNGLAMGAHRLLLKSYLYEEDLRVPLLIRGPRFPRGAVRDQPVSNVDLAPTIVEVTGVKPDRTMDGRSLLPVAEEGAGAGRELLFERAYDEAGTMEAGIRRGDWVYIDRAPFDVDELYDMRRDPWQLDNLLHPPVGPVDPADQAVADGLRARLVQLRACAGASCP